MQIPDPLLKKVQGKAGPRGLKFATNNRILADPIQLGPVWDGVGRLLGTFRTGKKQCSACLGQWTAFQVFLGFIVWFMMAARPAVCAEKVGVSLSQGVSAVWDLAKAHRQLTPTRERVCLNGLWRWQPATNFSDTPPMDRWGFFKVPGPWPGITDYMQKDCQTVYPHPSWAENKLGTITAAWYERTIVIPADWADRRIAAQIDYLNSYAIVFVDGRKAGEARFPAGDVEVTPLCRPGHQHTLSLLVIAMPLKGVMLSYTDSASAREVKGSVPRRGLCGDVYLVSTPPETRIADVKVETSVRRQEIGLDVAIQSMAPGSSGSLRMRIMEGERAIKEFASRPFIEKDLQNGRLAITERWMPDKLWMSIRRKTYTGSRCLSQMPQAECWM